MKKNNKNGFTLVELLAVIVILAIILVIAVPKVMSIIEDAKMGTLESTAKMIASQAEKQKVQNTVLGNDKAITCESITNINKEDYPSCEITFEDNTAKVTIVGGGKFEGLNVCEGTKTSAEATKEECTGGGVPVLNCTYDGELVQGAEFVHNQYTYRYMQEYNFDNHEDWNFEWYNIDQDGWGVRLTDLSSTEPVNTPICTYINGKPLVSTTFMFYEVDEEWNAFYSQAESIDVSSWNTSTVTNMSWMFYESKVTSLDLSNFDTSNVTNMSNMFGRSAATTIIGLSNFNTSNVTNMSDMFESSGATSLDISGFDTSKVTNMSNMFSRSDATTIIGLSNFNTSNVTNMSYMFFCSEVDSLDLSNFNTSKVLDMSYMFERSATINLDLSSFDTSNVTNMSNMFRESEAEVLDLSSFDTSNVTNMSNMFRESDVTTIYIGNSWNTTNVLEGDYMFYATWNLVGGNGTTYNGSDDNKTYARVDKEGEPGYFTYKASN